MAGLSVSRDWWARDGDDHNKLPRRGDCDKVWFCRISALSPDVLITVYGARQLMF